MSRESRQGRILLVDDDAALRFALRKALGRLGHDVSEAASVGEARTQLAAASGRGAPFDIALVDLQLDPTGRESGLDVLRASERGATRVVVLTGHGSVDAAVTAMRLGAFSFLEKPVDAEVLRPLLEQVVAERSAPPSATPNREHELVGDSAAICELRTFIARVGPTDETVSIFGETGAGKEVVARQVHLASHRAARPFVALNAATVPRDLFESELFGHKKGSFTGATSDRLGLFREASGGTLFIDELGELPLDSQAKLLRALEERRIRPLGESREHAVDVRIVAATNRDLWAEVGAGRFREDLYFRLHVFPLRVPPLRERLDDLPALATHLLGRIGSTVRRLDDEALEALAAHPWPGNVRELLNVLRRAALFASGDSLDGPLVRRMIAASIFAQPATVDPRPKSPPVANTPTPVPPPDPRSASPGASRRLSLAELERQHIEQTLAESGQNVTRAAIALGIDRRTLQRKLRGYGVVVADTDEREGGAREG